MIFDLSRLTLRQREQIERAIRGIRFDFERLRPGMQRAGIQSISVRFADLSEPERGAAATHEHRANESDPASTLGLWYSDGRVVLSRDLNDLGVRIVFAAEIAHAVDQLLLEPEDRDEIISAFVDTVLGPEERAEWWSVDPEQYSHQIGEAFMFAFMHTFTSYPIHDLAFRPVTPRVIAATRNALAPGASITRSIRAAAGRAR